jgi:peptide/nickel transport system permease protein
VRGVEALVSAPLPRAVADGALSCVITEEEDVVVASFIIRRLLSTVVVLLVASFVIYMLTAGFGDPLQDLRQSSDEGREQQMAARIALLNLDQPLIVRYGMWLAGIGGCFIGQCDLGISFIRGNQPVIEAVAGAAESTIQLITASTILAIILGVAVGMVTAIRQYSGFDYAVTFLSFVFYSLPIFWVAVLLKEFGALRLNEFLDEPVVHWWGYLIVFAVVGVITMSVGGGGFRRRALSFLISGGGAVALLLFLVMSGWFQRPSIGIVGILVTGVAVTVVVNLLSTGLSNRRALFASLATVLVWVAAWQPLQFLFFYYPATWVLILLAVVAIGVGIVAGLIFGRDDKRELARTAAITSLLTFGVVIIDRVLLVYPDYQARIPLSSGVISTIGSQTPGLQGDMWFQMLDTFAHLVLPTLALMVVSFAAYTRYSRASLLEVMNHDYVRTARAKGLTERTVIMRHAFRNALIPITTVIALDIGALIGGAVITETIFGWKGMGSLFVTGLDHADVNLVMGFFLVTGLVALFFNLVADLAYSALDPRIRVK